MQNSVLLLMLLAAGCTAASSANEPVIGGPCEGCEHVFVGIPAQITESARIAPSTEKGEPLVVEGSVRDAKGNPSAGIIVYAYQTNAGGVYPKGETFHGSLRAWVRSDKRGNFMFETVRPGSYPKSDVAQHIHLHVIEPGKGTYYIDDVIFADDPLLTVAQKKQLQRGRGGVSNGEVTRNPEGIWHARRDIVLGANIPN